MNKVDELSGVVAINDPTVALITESWLSADIPDSTINIGDKHSSFRLDRPTPGGGVLAYIRSDLPASRLSVLEEEGREVLWLLLRPPRMPRPFSAVVLVGVYYPPGQTVECEREMLNYLTHGLDTILTERPSTGVLICGDFNNLKLNTLCRRFNLQKLVKSPTRGEKILDQILTNMSDLFHGAKHLPPIGRSDHQCLLLTPKTKKRVPPFSKKVRLMKPGNLCALSLHMNLEDWEAVYSAQDVDDKVSAFNYIVIRMLDETCPLKTVCVHSTDKPWMKPSIKNEIKARQRAFTKGDMEKYKGLCTKVSMLISTAKASYYKSKAESQRVVDPEKWYKTIYALAAACEGSRLTPPPTKICLSSLIDCREALLCLGQRLSNLAPCV